MNDEKPAITEATSNKHLLSFVTVFVYFFLNVA